MTSEQLAAVREYREALEYKSRVVDVFTDILVREVNEVNDKWAAVIAAFGGDVTEAVKAHELVVSGKEAHEPVEVGTHPEGVRPADR